MVRNDLLFMLLSMAHLRGFATDFGGSSNGHPRIYLFRLSLINW